MSLVVPRYTIYVEHFTGEAREQLYVQLSKPVITFQDSYTDIVSLYGEVVLVGSSPSAGALVRLLLGPRCDTGGGGQLWLTVIFEGVVLANITST